MHVLIEHKEIGQTDKKEAVMVKIDQVTWSLTPYLISGYTLGARHLP